MGAGEAAPGPDGARGPLAGVRVLDLTSVLLGPYCTRTLGDMGAEVIKVEPPEGDPVRRLGPARSPGMGGTHLNLNRGKRSVVLDLKRAEARGAALRLAADCDVFVHNMRPSAAARLGLAYADVAAAAPGIVYCAAPGFGTEGPYRDRPAYDDMMQAASGIAALQARDGEAPRYVATVLADKVTGLMAATGILGALHRQRTTGVGGEVEVPMFETMASFLMAEHLYGAAFEPALGPVGYQRVTSPHRRPHATADGHIGVMPYTDRHWAAFFHAADRPDLAADPRFRDLAGRTAHIDALYEEVGAIVRTRPTAEWLRILRAADVPVSDVVAPADLLDDDHLRAVGLFETAAHPTEGAVRTVRGPVRFGADPAPAPPHAERLGESTAEILRAAGLDDAAIARLSAAPEG
ncbi:crotonobetainyl-CoA:carnitine CoA-transferase CaiB-like acyl-CoA transferase [Murinocardiopsis flavida]|uniref:Crotonobetainyl-CoA:carnitine CoA-transferase CaiB-like acyl-CoA transferase n=1 Tax=Murinocardiopsis flavida TaxID=645275 RepID=A0A2P8CXF2_9ACTN|nr:CoA transferase [Murinocardiopsis flavida]PSK89661.1 crotonobetainyl-CoA:carnitine CoA-transferase CaiB-like acyl-CoA transferase [Murinocardiopsis flavida]